MTIPEAVQAMPEAISDLLKKAYLQGFAVSAEGYNSEYPFNEDEAEIQSDKDWLGRRNEFLSSLALPFLQGVKPGSLVNDANIIASDMPHTVVKKLDAAYEARILSAIEIPTTSKVEAVAPSPRVSTSYEARICKGIPTDCCDYAVVDLSAGIEVCRVWKEDDARRIAELLNGEPSPRAQALEALKAAEQFIENGFEFGFIRKPDKGDTALETLPKIKAAICDLQSPTAEARVHVNDEGFRKGLEAACGVIDAHSEYDRQLCCDGRECGCYGATVHQSMQHYIRALSSQPVVDGWLPIETAPKDGTIVLLGWNDPDTNEIGAVAGWYEDGSADKCWYDQYHEPVTVTHWMPLRPLPASPGASE